MGKKNYSPTDALFQIGPEQLCLWWWAVLRRQSNNFSACFFFFFFCSQSGAKTFSHSLKARSLLPCLRATTCRKNCLPFTDSWHLNFKTCVRAAEPLVLILPLKVRKKEKGAGNSLSRVQFLQRNEESSHCVSWKPGRMPKEREKGTERGHG